MFRDTMGAVIEARGGLSPFGYRAGDVNLYRFVGNDPTTCVDPTGLATLKIDMSTWFYKLMYEQTKKVENFVLTRPKTFKEAGDFLKKLVGGVFAAPGNLVSYLTLAYLAENITDAIVHVPETNGKFDGTLDVTTKGQLSNSIDLSPLADLIPGTIHLGKGFKLAVSKYTAKIKAIKDELTDNSCLMNFTVEVSVSIEHGPIKTNPTDHFQFSIKPGEKKVIYWDETREFKPIKGDQKRGGTDVGK